MKGADIFWAVITIAVFAYGVYVGHSDPGMSVPLAAGLFGVGWFAVVGGQALARRLRRP